jgi:hypothetical protein
LGAFLALASAKNQAFRCNLFCGRGRKKGFPLQSFARPRGFQAAKQALRLSPAFRPNRPACLYLKHCLFTGFWYHA